MLTQVFFDFEFNTCRWIFNSRFIFYTWFYSASLHSFCDKQCIDML